MIVAILGAESTGKSTLAAALAQALGGTCVDEFLRAWCDRAGRTPRQDEQAGIAAEQARRIDAACAGGVVVADTTPLQTAVYSEIVFGDRSLHADALDWHRRRVDLTLLTALDLPWQPDGLQRDGPQVRAPVDALLRAALDGGGIGYAVVHGTGPARRAGALRAVRAAVGDETGAPIDAASERLWRPRCTECLQARCEHLLLPRR